MDSSAPTQPRTAATRIIAMLNQKGGVGKTTSAVNLGAAMAQDGQRVCLIDLDPQAHLTLHLGIDASQLDRTVYDLLIDPDCTAEDVLIRRARPNLDAMLAEVDLAGAETELAASPDRQDILRRKFQPIANDYDLVLIDCPPSLGLLTLNALALATEIFVPMQAHFLALQGVGRLLETVGLVCRSVNPALRVTGIILCMHEGQTTLAREVVADLDAFFQSMREQDVPWRDCRVLRPPVRRNIKLAEAPSFGKTIFDYEPWCPGALDYRKLAQHLIERWDGQDDGASSAPTPAEAPAEPVIASDGATMSASVDSAAAAPAEMEMKPTGEATAPDADEPEIITSGEDDFRGPAEAKVSTTGEDDFRGPNAREGAGRPAHV
jgi:chromosome partitioning protein